MDALASFYEDACVTIPKALVTKADLWKAYQAWAEVSGEQTYRTQRSFNAVIKRRAGVSEGLTGHTSVKTWFGIGLKSDEDTENDEKPSEPSEPSENPVTFSCIPYAYANFAEVGTAQTAQTANASPLEITATAALQQTAQSLAEARTRAHDGNRAAAECHGSDAQNRRLDYVGLLAEMALTDAMERHGLKPEGYRFLADRPPSEPDFTLRGKSYDVKACPPGKDFVTINAGKHENPKTRPDFYALCLFQNDEAFTVALVPAAAVDAWEKRDGIEKTDGTRRKPFFSRERKTLPLIRSLDEFAPEAEGKKWK